MSWSGYPNLETLRTPAYGGLESFQPDKGGYRGADHEFQRIANSNALGPHTDSNRDVQSSPFANAHIQQAMTIDLNLSMPGDVNDHEILFVLHRDDNYMSSGRGEFKGAERVMGLSRLNEWLRTDDEGLELGKFVTGTRIRSRIALAGVLITSMQQEALQKNGTKSITVCRGGRAVTPDITAWMNGEGSNQNYTAQTFDHLSVCFRRTCPKNPLRIEGAREFAPYWQIVPVRHVEKTPPTCCYRSIPYLTEPSDFFIGFYFHVGVIRGYVNGHALNTWGMPEKAYTYCFEKDGRSMSHISGFNELAQLELFICM